MKRLKAMVLPVSPLTAGFNSVFKIAKNSSALSSLVLGGLLLAVLSGCTHQAATPVSTSCERLVSFSPSITETVYALGLDKNLVGVTRFCKYPPQAQQKTSVGGYLDPNLEAVVRLRPTLVLLRQEQNDIRGNLNNFHLPSLSVEHRTAPGILASFLKIGETCNRQAEAKRLVKALEGDIARVQQKTRQVTKKPRVLLVVDRDIRHHTIRQVLVAAHENFYDWALRNAGAQNAMPGNMPGFHEVSAEGILRMNPDVIIEVMPSVEKTGLSQETLQRPWLSLARVSAVKNKRLYLFTQDYMTVPGPRFTRLLEELAETIHPELDWKTHD